MPKTALADALPDVRISDTYDYVKHHITPYLPKSVMAQVAARERTLKQPVLVLAMEIVSPMVCQNCGGGGKVFLKLTKAGPFQSPPNGVITWFDGNELYKKGWYVVDDTLSVDCPECGGGLR